MNELAIFSSLSRAETIRNYFVCLFLPAGNVRNLYMDSHKVTDAEWHKKPAIGYFAHNVAGGL